MELSLPITRRLLCLPVRRHGPDVRFRLRRNGTIVRYFNCAPCAPDRADFLSVTPVDEFAGETLTLEWATEFPAAFRPDWLRQEDAPPPAGDAPLRPLFHFTPARGWLNDPNGLFYYDGLYHLFYQSNPYSTGWGNMHWGHATSPDLLQWDDHGPCLFPDDAGTMYSGCAVLDEHNRSGLGDGTHPPVLLYYTAAGEHAPHQTGYTQNLAFSTDGGRTFGKYPGNPLLREIAPGNRDPKVIRDPASGRWLMALYRAADASAHRFTLLSSDDLLRWTPQQEITLPGSGECPDLFPLPVEEEPGQRRWIFTAADGHYRIGRLEDGRFASESGPHPFSHQAPGTLYAPQTWFDLPDRRRIQISWQRGDLPSRSFNQSMSLPVTLHLRSFADGRRLCAEPVAELDRWRGEPRHYAPAALAQPDFRAPLAEEAAEIELRFAPEEAFALTIRGLSLCYLPAAPALLLNGERLALPAPPVLTGEQTMRLLLDRASVELFAVRGRVYLGKRLPGGPQPPELTADHPGGIRALTIRRLAPPEASRARET